MALRKGSRRLPGLLASFKHVDAAADAVRALRARGHRDLTVYTASPNHEIEEALEHRVSPVRLFTLIGGLTGCAAPGSSSSTRSRAARSRRNSSLRCKRASSRC